MHDIFMYIRCFAALGDVSKARYLHNTNQLAEEAAKKTVCTNFSFIDGFMW